MDEKQNQPFQLSFNASLKVDFQASRVTSDGGLILIRELMSDWGLEKLIEEHLSDSRQDLNKQFTLADLTPLIALGPALVANSLFRGQEGYRMREKVSQIGNSGREDIMKIQNFAMVVALLVTLFSIPRIAAAQQTGMGQGVPVRMIVSVEAKKGNEIPTIMQHDIIVHQGHDVRQVTDWVPATGNNAGLALAILIDDSAGLNFDQQLNDIRAFIQEQAPTTHIAIGYMQNGTVKLAQNFTEDHAVAAKSLRLALGYYGVEASPYLSLSDFIKHWPADPGTPRREVLMITSGIDMVYMGFYPNPYVDASVKDAQCAGIVVYSIYTPSAGHFGHDYWRTYWAQNYLAELSDETGGESYYFMGPQGPVSFEPYLDKLNQQLPNQYMMTFMAEPKPKGAREPVKITSEIHTVDFVYADQVCVPAAGGQ